jgi:hypothetical protein
MKNPHCQLQLKAILLREEVNIKEVSLLAKPTLFDGTTPIPDSHLVPLQ